MRSEEEIGHWYVSSTKNWACDYNLRKALVRLRKADSKDYDAVIWWVPGPVEAEYEINDYRPTVEGSKYISHVDLKKGGPK
jgi:hypothetical protein